MTSHVNIQVKPYGGIFFDNFTESINNKSVRVHYTLAADDLALYRLHLDIPTPGSSKNGTKLDVDVHRRWVSKGCGLYYIVSDVH